MEVYFIYWLNFVIKSLLLLLVRVVIIVIVCEIFLGDNFVIVWVVIIIIWLFIMVKWDFIVDN